MDRDILNLYLWRQCRSSRWATARIERAFHWLLKTSLDIFWRQQFFCSQRWFAWWIGRIWTAATIRMSKMTEESKTDLGLCVDESRLSCRQRGFEGWLSGWTDWLTRWKRCLSVPRASDCWGPWILVRARCQSVPFVPLHFTLWEVLVSYRYLLLCLC